MSKINFECNEIVLKNISELKVYPDNEKLHPTDEGLIKRLIEIFKENGFRNPIKINKETNMITCGHARVEALKRLGETQVPCLPQEYKSKELEFADIVADNATNEWRQINLEFVKAFELKQIPLNVLGIKDFLNDKFEIEEKEVDENIITENECPNCGFKF